MNNLKTFEEFDWTLGLGKKEPTRPTQRGYQKGEYTDMLDKQKEEYAKQKEESKVYEDQELFDKIKNKIETTFDPNKVSHGYVAHGNHGYIYDFGKLLVKLGSGQIGIIKKEDDKPMLDIETLDVNRRQVSALYFFIEQKMGEYSKERRNIAKQEFDSLIERRKNK